VNRENVRHIFTRAGIMGGALLAALLFTGCLSWKNAEVSLEKPQPTTLDIAVIAADTKTPLAVYFFGLKSVEHFKKLDYFELIKPRDLKLRREIVTRSKTILSPGEMEKRSVRLGKKIRYYAVVVGFKDALQNDGWRYIQKIEPETKNDITLILGQDSMRRVAKQ